MFSIGPFTCLDCEERLALRRPHDKRAHFAHRPDSLCVGETALHRYAKELLEQQKTLTLPTLILQDEGLSEIVFQPGKYDFETVVPEQNLGTFQPDAIVTYKGVELAIEFLVSHAVDGEKRAKVIERDLSMVEIDLSGVRAGHFSAEEVDEAILHSAARSWIYHRRRAAVVKKLADKVAAQRAERGGRLRWHINKRIRPTYPVGWAHEAATSVEQAGLMQLVDLEVNCDHWFIVPRAIWQADALNVHVIEPSRLFSPGGRNIALKGKWPNEHSLASKLPDWMIRSDLSAYTAKRLAEAGFDRSTFGSADQAVWNYFAALHEQGCGVIWSDEDQAFLIEPELHGRLHRRVELRRVVIKLLGAVEHDNPERGFRRWASTYKNAGVTPAELVEAGGTPYRSLLNQVVALEGTLPSYSRKIVEDLCGLPLENIRERNRAAIALDETERARKAQGEADARWKSIRCQAERMLEGDAAKWLARPVQAAGVSVAEFASASDRGLYEAEHWLAAAANQRRQATIAAKGRAALRADLTQAARQAFADPALADLFLNTGQPKIGGRHPIEFCDSKQALGLLKTLLPKRR